MSVTLYIGNTAADLAVNTVIAITRQVHDITNLESRNGDNSNTFKLPLTSKNKALLGWANDLNSYSDIPYTRIDAILDIDGVQTGGYLQLDSVESEAANCVFYSGNSDFFDLLSDSTLNDLDLSAYDTYWNIDGFTPNVFSTKSNTTGVVWPIVEYGTEDLYNTLPTNLKNVNPITLRPALYVSTLLDLIAANTGYVFNGLDLPAIQAEVIPCVTADPKHSTAFSEQNKFAAHVGTSFNCPALVNTTVDFDVIDNDPSGNFSGTVYTAPYAGQYTFKFVYTAELVPPAVNSPVVNVTPIAIAQIVSQDGLGNQTVHGEKGVIYQTSPGPDFIIVENIDLAKGDIVYCKMLPGIYSAGGVNLLVDTTFELLNINDGLIAYGDLFELTGNMPDVSIRDFIKSLMQRYNLIAYTDVQGQVVNFFRYTDVYNNEPVDWTNKIDTRERAIDFHPEFYGQDNIFKWQYDGNITEGFADGKIEISDVTLSKQIVTIEQPFAASVDVKRLNGLNVARIELLDFDSTEVASGLPPAIATKGQLIVANTIPKVTNAGMFWENIKYRQFTVNTYKFETVKPRILYIMPTIVTDGGITYDDGDSTANDDSTTEPLSYFAPDGYDMKLTFAEDTAGLMEYYTELKFALTKFKRLTAFFNLKAVDVLNFDFQRPVVIQGLGKFYVNKIVNYVPNRLTKVELILM